MSAYRVSVRRSCGLIGLSRTVWYYQSVSTRDDGPIIMRMKEITETRVRYGVERVHTLLRREGYLINHKRTYRTIQSKDLRFIAGVRSGV
jgi:putative transposase